MTAVLTMGHVMWPDEKELRRQDWWNTAVWVDGPTYGDLVLALMPVLRVSFLHGYQIRAINIGYGPGVPAEHTTIDLETLELAPGEWISEDLPDEGPGIWFDTYEVADLIAVESRNYATGLVIPIFSGLYTDDHSVPAEMVDQIEAFAEAAIVDLVPLMPDEFPAPRTDGGGLLWVFDSNWWFPNVPGMRDAQEILRYQMTLDKTGFLRGQVFADASRHRASQPAGPASLYFVMTLHMAAVRIMHLGFWNHLLWELQARGEAIRLLEDERNLYRSYKTAPTWLDVLAGLLRRGVVVIEDLVHPGEPPTGLTCEISAQTGDTVDAVTLWAWGEHAITLRRETEFPDQAEPGIMGSVAWDYAPGSAHAKPAVLIVAGRGVAIDHTIKGGFRYRPWELVIYRVQDDAYVPGIGEVIDPVRVVPATQIEPYEEECHGPDITDVELAAYPQLTVKPKPDGVYLIYPTAPGVTATEVSGETTTDHVPAVVELTVDPLSGTDAYTIDVHYFTEKFLDPSMELAFAGGAHVTIWLTEGVQVHTNMADDMGPTVGNPSVFMDAPDNHLVLVEVWHMNQRELMPRPWRADLPVLPWDVAAPQGYLAAFFLALWEGLAPQSWQDVFTGDRDNPFPEPVPSQLEYDSVLRHAAWFDEFGSQQVVDLAPAPYSYRVYQYVDSLLFDGIDIAISFIPVVGDIADIGEAVYAYQTGLDKWGRPVSQFQLGLLGLCAVIPVLSSGMVRSIVRRLGDGSLTGAAEFATKQDVARLSAPANWHNDLSLTQAQAAAAEPSLLRGSLDDGLASDSRRAMSQELVTTMRLSEESGSIANLTDDLLTDRFPGWISVHDLLARRNQLSGFCDVPLQITYLRHLRRDPTITPLEFFGTVHG